jgi:hypothetical protein
MKNVTILIFVLILFSNITASSEENINNVTTFAGLTSSHINSITGISMHVMNTAISNITISNTTVPNITIMPILKFDETEAVFTEEEKSNYAQLFTEFLKLQDDSRITNFFYSSDGKPLQYLKITKTPSAGASAHMGTYIQIFDNGIRAGMSQRDFFFHEMGHLIVYVDHFACCGGYPTSEGVASLVVSEANKGQPNKIIFGNVTSYSEVAFAEQWYKHAEKWNYTITNHTVNSNPPSEVTVREDREFVYIAQALVYNKLINGYSISDSNTAFSALNEATNIKGHTYIIPTKVDIVAYYIGLGLYPDILEADDLLKASNDWRNNVVPSGFNASISTDQLLKLSGEWRNS